jgi:hypothetical protein
MIIGCGGTSNRRNLDKSGIGLKKLAGIGDRAISFLQ